MAGKPKSRTGEYRAIQRLLAKYIVAYEAGEYEKARQLAITAKKKYDVDLRTMYNEKSKGKYGEKKENTVVYE